MMVHDISYRFSKWSLKKPVSDSPVAEQDCFKSKRCLELRPRLVQVRNCRSMLVFSLLNNRFVPETVRCFSATNRHCWMYSSAEFVSWQRRFRSLSANLTVSDGEVFVWHGKIACIAQNLSGVRSSVTVKLCSMWNSLSWELAADHCCRRFSFA